MFIITPSLEECDDYQHLWRIDSVIDGEHFMYGKQIYLLNSKKDYAEDSKHLKLFVKGNYLNEEIVSDYANCGQTLKFEDLVVREIP